LVTHGAAAGAISSLGGSTMQAMKFSDPAMITGSAALGGLGSMIVGGDFWQGFGQGMAVGLFNHAMEHGFDRGLGDPPKTGDWRLSQGSWGMEEIYDGSKWVLKDNGRFWPAQGVSKTTESPIEWLINPSGSISLINDIGKIGISKGYTLTKTIASKYDVFQKTVIASNLTGQARAIWTQVVNKTTGGMIRMYKDAFRSDGRHYERAHYKPHKYRSKINK
jgi:hypothetical protein